MRISVSVPEKLFKKVEGERKLLKMSRSEFYKKAAEYYLENGMGQEMICRINKVCEEVDTSLDPVLRRYVIESLARSEWNEA